MKKKLAIITLCTGFFSCSSLMYNYTQDEFTTEYIRTVRYFDKTVDGPIKKSDLRKLGKKFTFLKKQLHKNNENYQRLNEETVKVYDEKIDEYLMFVKDLED